MSQDVTAEHLKLMADKGMHHQLRRTLSSVAELQPIGATLTAEWLKKAGPAGEQLVAAIASSSRPLKQIGRHGHRGGLRRNVGAHA